MRRLLFLLISFLAGIGPAHAQHNPYGIQDSVKVLLDSTMSLMQRHSLGTDRVSWATLRPAVYTKAANAQTLPEAAPAIAYLYEALGDYHGWFVYGKQNISWERPQPAGGGGSAAVRALIAKGPKMYSTLLPGGIGYLRIPSLSVDSASVHRFAQRFQDSLQAMNAHRPLRGLIVDLRANTGGSMYPMLGGLAPVLGTGEVGSFRTASGKVLARWIIRQGNLYVEGEGHTRVARRGPDFPATLPVAVLLSGMTASAGEDVAIGLRGRPHTRFFGERTAGYTTANDGYYLHGNAGFNLATSLAADRTGRIYPHDVVPDEVIEGGDQFDDLGQDRKVQAALRWLKRPGRRSK